MSGILPGGKRGKHAARRRLLRPLVMVPMALTLLVGALAAATYAYAKTAADHLLPGLNVSGVDVGGMTRAQATAAVQADVTKDLARTITVEAAGRTWTTSPADLGVQPDITRAVNDVFAASNSPAWPVSAYDRLTHHPLGRTIQVRYTFPEAEMQALVTRVASSLDRPAIGAAMSLRGNQLMIQKPKTGRKVDVSTGVSNLLDSLRTGKAAVTIPVRIVKPKVTAKKLGKTLTVNLSTNTLRLFRGFKLIKQFPVATARPGFVTPIGEWMVVQKEFMPSWYNPAPNGWAKDMPKYIPPGPGNPLGLRALALDASGILIHGTPEAYSIGTYASHGCIRMFENDAIALFPLVPQGAKVIIYGAPPWGNVSSGATAGF